MTRTIRTVAVALLLAVAVVVSLGATTIDVKAEKKTYGSVADRTESQRELCETLGGGKLAVMDGPAGSGSNTTECKGGTNDGWTCYNTAKTTDCHSAKFQNVKGSQYDATIASDDIEANEQPAPRGNVAGGNYNTPLTGEVLPLEPDPAATPVDNTTGAAADDPVVTDSEPTGSPEDVVNESGPDVVVDQPMTADPGAAGGAIEGGDISVEQIAGVDGGLYFHLYEQ
jgi:hypothetical protein